MDVRDRVRAAIVERGITQASVAKEAHMTAQCLTACFKKRRYLRADELIRLCAAIPYPVEKIASEYMKERANNAKTS